MSPGPANAAERFAKAVAHCQVTVSNRERAGWAWPLGEITKDKTADAMQTVNSYVEPIIKEAIV